MSLASEPQRRRSRPKSDGLADEVIRWIEKACIIPEGKFFGQPVKLLPFQKDIITQIYDNPQGTRRAILSFPRKNAKTSLAAFTADGASVRTVPAAEQPVIFDRTEPRSGGGAFQPCRQDGPAVAGTVGISHDP
jgi:hypothetical protein